MTCHSLGRLESRTTECTRTIEYQIPFYPTVLTAATAMQLMGTGLFFARSPTVLSSFMEIKTAWTSRLYESIGDIPGAQAQDAAEESDLKHAFLHKRPSTLHSVFKRRKIAESMQRNRP